MLTNEEIAMSKLQEYPALIARKAKLVEEIQIRLNQLKRETAEREWEFEAKVINDPLYKNEGMRKHGKAGMMLDDAAFCELLKLTEQAAFVKAVTVIEHQQLRDEFAAAKLLHQIKDPTM